MSRYPCIIEGNGGVISSEIPSAPRLSPDSSPTEAFIFIFSSGFQTRRSVIPCRLRRASEKRKAGPKHPYGLSDRLRLREKGPSSRVARASNGNGTGEGGRERGKNAQVDVGGRKRLIGQRAAALVPGSGAQTATPRVRAWRETPGYLHSRDAATSPIPNRTSVTGSIRRSLRCRFHESCIGHGAL